jgi:hypothetical protein
MMELTTFPTRASKIMFNLRGKEIWLQEIILPFYKVKKLVIFLSISRLSKLANIIKNTV